MYTTFSLSDDARACALIQQCLSTRSHISSDYWGEPRRLGVARDPGLELNDAFLPRTRGSRTPGLKARSTPARALQGLGLPPLSVTLTFGVRGAPSPPQVLMLPCSLGVASCHHLILTGVAGCPLVHPCLSRPSLTFVPTHRPKSEGVPWICVLSSSISPRSLLQASEHRWGSPGSLARVVHCA